MAINSRAKGAGAERELARLLFEELGIKLQRNLEQSRSGGYDLLAESGSLLAPYAIEVKRYAKATSGKLKSWWTQAVSQATQTNKTPVLMYREDRADWLVVIPLCAINGNLSASTELTSTATLSLPAFCAVVRG